jgi:hypothetical protein
MTVAVHSQDVFCNGQRVSGINTGEGAAASHNLHATRFILRASLFTLQRFGAEAIK